MKLYIANGTYVGTQADAKRLDRGFEQVEVPTDKEGLIAYLNRMIEYASKTEHKEAAEAAAEVSTEIPEGALIPRDQRIPGEPIVKQPIRTSTTVTPVTQVVEFILDGATTADIENVFCALGTRFSEMQREALTA